MAGLECPSCDGDLSQADRTSGPEAPEVGWEYYECPHCGGKIRPETIESDVEPGHNCSEGDTRKFSGVVVNTSSSVILDDGDEVVECSDLDSHAVSLGEEVTVVGKESDADPSSNNAADDATVLTDCSLST